MMPHPRQQWVIAGFGKGLHPPAAASQLSQYDGRLAKLSAVDPGISSPDSTFADGWIAPATLPSSGHEGCLPDHSPRYLPKLAYNDNRIPNLSKDREKHRWDLHNSALLG
jgi:hypothetical protein